MEYRDGCHKQDNDLIAKSGYFNILELSKVCISLHFWRQSWTEE
jgi:hypothetical protein